jgi:hypothetical protein
LSNDPNDFIFGDGWYDFLLSSRTILGSEGGSGIHDPEGIFRKVSDEYVLNHPEASYEETRDACFKDEDNKFPYYAISPRHFEAVLSMTCQVLVEGRYNGILKPDLHYIPVKKDWSNIEEVFSKIKDKKYCEDMVKRAYSDVILNGTYTYKDFVKFVLEKSAFNTRLEKDKKISNTFLEIYMKYPLLYSPLLVLRNYLVEGIKRIIWLLKLDKNKNYKKLEFFIFKKNYVR